MSGRISQGDQYSIAMTIKFNDEPLDISNVDKIEFTLHDTTRMYPDEVSFSDGTFFFPVTQEETFSLPRIVEAQARIKFENGDVFKTPTQKIDVDVSLSKEIL